LGGILLIFLAGQGREEEKLIIAKNLLLKGSTPEFIREITGLDTETVKKLVSLP
jgi:hypothetical protein